MTTSVRRISCAFFVVAAVMLAIALAPGRAFAHEAIPGTRGMGTSGNPVVVDNWIELKQALELEENLYIQAVDGDFEKTASDGNLFAEGTMGDCIVIPKGYAKDLDVETQLIYESNSDQGKFANFIFINDNSTLIIHSADTKAIIDVGSGLGGCTAICNRGELYVYGNVSIHADRLQQDGARYACGIVCAGDSKLVISGSMENNTSGKPFNTYCEIRGSAETDLSAGIGGAVYVQSASSVDIFGGRLESRNNGSGTMSHNGLVINADYMDKVRVHGGVVKGLSFVGNKASNYVAGKIVGWATNINQFAWDNYYFVTAQHDDFTLPPEIGGDPCRQWVHNIEAQVKPLNSVEAWNALSAVQSFTAGDGVTYNLSFSGDKAVGVAAVAYRTCDPSVVMTSKPVYPVLYRDSDADDDFGVCKALPTLLISPGTFNPMDGAWEGTTIASVELPEDITFIGAAAFAGTNLTEVFIPNKVNIIEAGAFEDSKLEKVTIPVLENGPTLLIGDDAFSGSHLKEISCAFMGDVDIYPHSYGFYQNDEGDYVRNEPLDVYAMPDSPFWEDAVKKGFIYDLRAATVEAIPDQTYTTVAIEPKPKVTAKVTIPSAKTVELKEGVDYEVTYSKNIDAGTAEMSLTALGCNYGGKTANFTIKKASMADASVSNVLDCHYTGLPILQGPTVYLGDKPLVEGHDYELSYKDNVNVGTATVTLTGINNMTGSQSFPFKIFDSTSWKRLAGDNALDTMVKIVDEGSFPVGGTVVLASLEGYWDALTAAGVAGLEDAPVLMALPDSLPKQTADMLAKLAPKKIVVCGGQYWLPDSVIMLAQGAAGSYPDVVRLAGDNAAQTAAKIAAYGKDKWSDTAIVATAGTFQDALAAAPVAYASDMPIFLAQFDLASEKGYIDKATIDAMKDIGITQCYIAGGEYWLPKSITDDLKAAGVTVIDQLGGKTAVETSALIAQLACDKFGMSANGMGVADVQKHYDALASAAFCGKNNSVLVLALDEKSSVIDGFVQSHATTMMDAYIFGGTSSVSEATEAALKAVTK